MCGNVSERRKRVNRIATHAGPPSTSATALGVSRRLARISPKFASIAAWSSSDGSKTASTTAGSSRTGWRAANEPRAASPRTSTTRARHRHAHERAQAHSSPAIRRSHGHRTRSLPAATRQSRRSPAPMGARSRPPSPPGAPGPGSPPSCPGVPAPVLIWSRVRRCRRTSSGRCQRRAPSLRR